MNDLARFLYSHIGLLELLLGSLSLAAVSTLFERFVRITQRRAKEIRQIKVGGIQVEFRDEAGQIPEQDTALVVATSPASNVSARVPEEVAIAELRQQLSELAKQRSEIVEVQKIDPVLEATLKASIENLTKRIEGLEKKTLEKWDVAMVFLQLLGAVGALVGVVLGIAKYFLGK